MKQTSRPARKPAEAVIKSISAALRALAQRWLILDAEKEHDVALDALTDTCASSL
jgi:hypothetical protein